MTADKARTPGVCAVSVMTGCAMSWACATSNGDSTSASMIRSADITDQARAVRYWKEKPQAIAGFRSCPFRVFFVIDVSSSA